LSVKTRDGIPYTNRHDSHPTTTSFLHRERVTSRKAAAVRPAASSDHTDRDPLFSSIIERKLTLAS